MFEKLKNILDVPHHVKRLSRQVESLEEQLDILRSRLDLDPGMMDRFLRDRMTTEYESVYSLEQPLVTICIATYNRSQLLVERSVRSALGQTYPNIEVLVVGDCCTDDTEARLQAIGDPRLSFVNLAQRGDYPSDPSLRWMVAGTSPLNHALTMARGAFITHLDDDDEFMPDRVERLLGFIRDQRADIVWHPFWRENNAGKWALKDCLEFKAGMVTTSSVFYHRWFASILWDLHAYRNREPGDWNRFRKFKYLGVRGVRYPDPLLRHYMERSQLGK
jgi:glycosyltransferase involved in cell wall biosynthesis